MLLKFQGCMAYTMCAFTGLEPTSESQRTGIRFNAQNVQTVADVQ